MFFKLFVLVIPNILIITKINEIKITDPITTGKSILFNASTISFPRPFQAKIYSTNTAPASSDANHPETAVITGLEGGVFSFDQEPDDGSVIDPDSGILTGGNSGTEYLISYTTNSECPSTTINSVTPIEGEDSSFELTAPCDGAIANITGIEGGIFSFSI